MNKRMLLYIFLFVSLFGLQGAEEKKYTSSTMTKACKEAKLSSCKEKATQTKDFIFAFKKAYKIYKNLDAKERFKKCFELAQKKVAK